MASAFGIAATNTTSEGYSIIRHQINTAGSLLVKFDMKINQNPESDIGFALNGPNGEWKSVQMNGIGVGTIAHAILAHDMNDFTGANNAWGESLGIHHMEIIISPEGNNDIIVREDGNTKLTWKSPASFSLASVDLGLLDRGGTELANFQLCDTSGCETITPTPPPPPVTKVVVIPGFGGSWNADAILHCKTDNYQGLWTSWSGADPIYNPIITSLNNSGFTAQPFYYDWRKQLPDTAPLLATFIHANTIPNEKVDIVGHSMGGLIGSAYIQQEGGHNKADTYMSVGAPHKGTLLSYPAWSGGEIYGTLPMRIAATIAIRKCKDANPRLSNREIIQQFFPSIQNLLPTFDYLKDIRTRQIKPVADMLVKNNWLPTNGLFTGTRVGTLSGYGFDTLRFFGTLRPSRRDVTLGNWRDGMPARREFVGDGDGTVLQMSSQLLGADNRLLPKNHTELISSSEGISEILKFLTPGTSTQIKQTQTTFTEPKTALVIIGYPGNFSVAANGQTIQDKNGIVVLFDPKPGAYNFKLLPKSPNTEIIVAQFLEGDRTLWKSYQWKSRLPKLGNIKFDPLHPIEDALK